MTLPIVKLWLLHMTAVVEYHPRLYFTMRYVGHKVIIGHQIIHIIDDIQHDFLG